MTAANPADTIWFHPPKFWSATKVMSDDETKRLLNEVIFLAEIRDVDALRKFPFISVGPHKTRHLDHRSVRRAS